MQLHKYVSTIKLLAVSGLMAVSSANAATASGSFNVNLTITSVCAVVASPTTQDINFGSHAAGTASATIGEQSSAAAITVTCSKNAPYAVNLTPSNGNTLGAGTMTGPGSDTVDYQLTQAAAGDAWGNTATLGAAGNGVSGIGAGLAASANTHTVFATVASTTDVQPGDYSDTVNVAVIY